MKNFQGFSMTELLVAAAIVSILGMVAYPTYIEALIDGRRSEAQQELLKTAVVLERFYSRNGVYPAKNDFNGLPTLEYYTFSYDPSALTGQTELRSYVLTATPKDGVQSQDPCSALTLNQIGTQGAAIDDCW